jgi:hypothetical protein
LKSPEDKPAIIEELEMREHRGTGFAGPQVLPPVGRRSSDT